MRKRLLAAVASMAMLVVGMTAVAGAATDDLDPGFGTTGIATIDPMGIDWGATDMAVDAAGRIVVALESGDDEGITGLARLDSDGQLDPSFNGDGIAYAEAASGLPAPMGSEFEFPGGVAIQSDGNILVAGSLWTGSEYDVYLMRFTTNGSYDTTFGGGDGIVITDLADWDFGGDIGIQSDGKILVASRSQAATSDAAVIRYNTNGSLDTSYGSSGAFRYDSGGYDAAGSLAVDDQGRAVFAVDPFGSDLAVMRVTTGGAADPTFSGDGLATLSLGAGLTADSNAVAIDPQGRISVVGLAQDTITLDHDLVVGRFLPGGAVDTSFSSDGYHVQDINGGVHDHLTAVVAGDDSSLTVAGGGDDTDFLIGRYTAEGLPDPTFGGDGFVTVPVSVHADSALSIALAPDGAILAAGRAQNATADDGFAIVIRFEAPPSPTTTTTLPNEAPPSPTTTTTLPNIDFTDDDGSIHETDIEELARRGITNGCEDTLYCPDNPVTRDQMAAFLTRTLGLEIPTAVDTFTDDNGSIFEGVIEALAAEGVTKGCTDTQYCPTDAVTRGQMAAFLTRAFGLTAPIGIDTFDDDDQSVFQNDIEALAAAGVTKGCTDTQYCPEDAVTRAQMASFIIRAIHLSD